MAQLGNRRATDSVRISLDWSGVDLADLNAGSIVVDSKSASVVITLPPAEILYIAVDGVASHVYNRSTDVFTRGDPTLERSARQVAEDILQTQALEGGILNDA